ncbi:MAG: SDR family oxidoreductase [Hyphomonadaceae bacterium]|nr:SDR family oxidoreductase [Hyphomonadaceae bacterium]
MDGEWMAVLGGSRGIGLAAAKRALARGAEVVIGARGAHDLERARTAFPKLRTAVCDVTDRDSLAAFFSGLPRLDHLFYAAGAFSPGGVRDGDLALARAGLETRVWGAACAIRAALPKLAPNGTITLTGGVSTDRPAPGAWSVSVGTAAAEQMARALALELAPIRVNAIAPGWTDTPMWDAILGAAKTQTFAEIGAKTLVGRIATADEIADAALFLMNNRSVTGEVVHVDGGLRLA